MSLKMITNEPSPRPSAFENISDNRSKIEAKAPSFESELLEQEDEGVTREQMEELLKQIDEQAQRLSKTPTYDELKSYRSLIKNFV